MAIFFSDRAAAGRVRRATVWMPTKHLGNLLVSMKAMESLANHFGPSNTTLVVDSAYRDIMDSLSPGCPVAYYPRASLAMRPRWRALPPLWRFLRAVRGARADLAIALEGDMASQRFVPLSGPGDTLGPDNRYCQRFRRRITLNHGQRHRFHDYATVAAAVTGQALEPGYAPLRATVEGQNQVDARLADLGLNPARPLTVLHPGASKPYKQWPSAFFAEVARWLHGRGQQVVVTGAGHRDEVAIAELQRKARTPFASLLDRLGLAGLIALCQRATCFIGNDTGPTHLAAASGTPTLAIFGPTDENRWGPLGDNVRVLRHQRPCLADCRRGRCRVGHRCINSLSASSVQDAVTQWL